MNDTKQTTQDKCDGEEGDSSEVLVDVPDTRHRAGVNPRFKFIWFICSGESGGYDPQRYEGNRYHLGSRISGRPMSIRISDARSTANLLPNKMRPMSIEIARPPLLNIICTGMGTR